MARYQVKNQWGGSSASWNEGGVWELGSRSNQGLVAVDITSNDNGKTFTGTVTYAGEGPIAFKAEQSSRNQYSVQNKWGDSGWQPGGTWTIGGRDNQSVVAFKANSSDQGKTFTGTMTYAGEGSIGFQGTLQ